MSRTQAGPDLDPSGNIFYGGKVSDKKNLVTWTSTIVYNWLKALFDALYPAKNTETSWLIQIPILSARATSANFNWAYQSTVIGAGWLVSSGTQNDEVTWPIILGAGTWTFLLVNSTGTNRGIYTVYFDDVSKGTIDGYSGAQVDNVLSTIAGISVTTTGKVTLKVKMATKSTSSSAYYGVIQHISLLRTA